MDIVLINSFKDFKGLEKKWENLTSIEAHNRDYYLSYNWFYALLTCSESPPENLHILSVFEDDVLIAIFPLSIYKKKYRGINIKSLEFIGNIYSPLRGPIYFKKRQSDIAHCIFNYLLDKKNSHWDVLNFTELSKHDSLSLLLTQLLASNSKNYINSDSCSNIISDISQFTNSGLYFKSLSKKLRQTIRTGLNRAHKDFNLSIRLSKTSMDNIEHVMDHYYDVYDNSWKIQEEDSTFHRNLAHYLSGQGKLRIFVLYSHDTTEEVIPNLHWDSEILLSGPASGLDVPIAAIFMIVHEGIAYYLKTSYRESHAKLSVGMILFWHAMKYLIDIDNIKTIDHQKGSEQYKLKWGCVHEVRYNFKIANPRKLKARLIILFEAMIIPVLKRLRKTALSYKQP